jgi:hypothetical protein
VVLRIESNRPTSELDAICVELDAGGITRFGRRYDLGSAPLPQTLTAVAGGRTGFQSIVYGLHHGVEVVRARNQVTFRDGAVARLDVSLDECVAGSSSGRFQSAGTTQGAVDRVALGPAPSGGLVLSLAAGRAARSHAAATGFDPLEAGTPSPPAGAIVQVVSADLDADCRLDAVVLSDGAPPVLWTHAIDGTFAELAGALPLTAPMKGAAAGDVDGDGNPDLVLAGGGELHLLANDGAGHFHEVPSAFDVAPTDATAVALGDLDGDGHLDAVVAQGSAAPGLTRVYLNDSKGSGHFALASAALPPRMERASAVALADFDGDGDLDLAIAHLGAPVRLYLNRGNAFLEDRSFGGLPDQIAGDVPTLLAADLNADCLPDLIVPRAGGAPLVWLNAGGGMLVAGPPLVVTAAALGAAADDVTDDGLPDLVLFGSNGLTLEVQK